MAATIQKITVNHRGGDVFDMCQEPSDRAVLWGELIKEKERRFLRNLLREGQICFSVRDTFQISIRTVWRPESDNKATGARMMHRKGRVAMLLHDTAGRLTTSWTWLKLVLPLYQMGLSVILVDLPGLGKSSINNVSTLDPSVWRGHEGHILCHILDELKVSKCHVVACGNSCSALIRMIKHSPHQLEKEHILHNPVLDYDDVFKDRIRGPAPGAGANWREEQRASQQHELENFLISSEVKIFATFDQAGYTRTRDTHESFMTARKHVVLNKNLQVMEVTREDICEAQIGAKVPVAFLVLRKELRDRYACALQHRRDHGATSALSPTGKGPNYSVFGCSNAGLDSPANRAQGMLQDTPLGGTGGTNASLPGMNARSKSAGALEGMQRAGYEAHDPGSTLGKSSPWYATAFATGPEWMGSTTGTLSPRMLQSRAFTSEAAKKESMLRLCGDPRNQRERLLSALPNRTRHNIRAIAPATDIRVKDLEPATQAEERQMIEQAIKKSKQDYRDQLQMAKSPHLKRTF